MIILIVLGTMGRIHMRRRLKILEHRSWGRMTHFACNVAGPGLSAVKVGLGHRIVETKCMLDEFREFGHASPHSCIPEHASEREQTG